MIHIVKEKFRKEDGDGFTYQLSLKRSDKNLWSLLWVTRADYDAVTIGQEVEITVDPIFPPMPAAAERAINGPDAPTGGGK